MIGGLPRRDLWLLPLIAFATLILLGLVSEVAARMIWPEQQRDACEKADGSGFKSDCASRVKIAEGPWVEYRYNDCGLRADRPCAKLPGERRIAVVGSSISQGYWVPFGETFAGRLERTFDQTCPNGMDVQTEKSAGPGGNYGDVLSQLPAALALHPDVIVTVVAPYDLEKYMAPSPPSGKAAPIPSILSLEGMKGRLKFVTDSRAAHMAQHFLYLDLNRYLPLYLKHGDAADFLRPPLTPAWKARLAAADHMIGWMSDQARARHVPLVVVFLPNRPETALAAAPEAGIDPFALPDALGKIVRAHGAIFVDLTKEAARANAPNTLFYPVDGHPTGAAHALIAKALVPLLISSVGAFANCVPKRPESARVGLSQAS